MILCGEDKLLLDLTFVRFIRQLEVKAVGRYKRYTLIKTSLTGV